MNLDIVFVDPLLSLLFQALYLSFFFILRFVDLFFGALFSFNYLVAELKHLLHQFGIISGQFFNQDLTFLHLAFEVFNKTEVVATDSQYFFVLLGDMRLHLLNVTAKTQQN